MTDNQISEALGRAMAMEFEGRQVEAGLLLRQLLSRQPGDPAIRLAWGQHLLLLGRYAEAWHFVESRFHIPGVAPPHFPPGILPRLRAEDIPGRRVLVWAEQGFGDLFMLARLVPMLVDRGADVTLWVFKGLAPVMSRLGPGLRVIEGQCSINLREFDAEIPLMDVPGLLDIVPETVPGGGYLSAEPGIARRWRERLSGPGLKIGLAWQGNPGNPRDAERSMPLAALVPLMTIPDAHFFGLQAGGGEEQVAVLDPALPFTDLAPDFKIGAPFAEMAGAIENLDMVIAIDSAVAHFTAALGRPLWLMLAKIADWRYGLPPGPGPWHREARQFRKPDRVSWEVPVAEARAALLSLKAGGGA